MAGENRTGCAGALPEERVVRARSKLASLVLTE
jgi:hypothetical protein